MTLPDTINSCFLAGGTFMYALNVRSILRDKKTAGFSVLASSFFFLWGLWDMFYWPFLGQWFSFVAGIGITCMSGTWLSLIIYYRLSTKLVPAQDDVDWHDAHLWWGGRNYDTPQPDKDEDA